MAKGLIQAVLRSSTGTAVSRIMGRKFVRSVVAVASGTAAAQAIAMLLSPLITRLYGPEAFGLLGVFNSVIGIAAPAASLTYQTAIVLPEDDREALQLVRLSMYIAITSTILVAGILVIFGQPIVDMLQLEVIYPLLFLIPFTMLFVAAQQISQQWLIRMKKFGAIGKTNILQALIVSGSQVVMGLIMPVSAALVYIFSAGRLIHAGAQAQIAVWDTQASGVDQKSSTPRHRMNLGNLARRYIDFPLYRAPQVIINAASQGLPLLMLTAFYGPAVGGFYALCRTVLGLPSQLIGTSVGEVFYPRISQAAQRGENLTRLIVRATLVLAAIGCLPYVSVAAFGPHLFTVVFGEEWQLAGEFARWIALWRLAGLMNRPAVQAIPVLGAQKMHLAYTIMEMFVRLGVLTAGYLLSANALFSIALFGLTGMILNFALICLVIRFSRKFDAVGQPRGVR